MKFDLTLLYETMTTGDELMDLFYQYSCGGGNAVESTTRKCTSTVLYLHQGIRYSSLPVVESKDDAISCTCTGVLVFLVPRTDSEGGVSHVTRYPKRCCLPYV
jgi:hypothetical protein